jgi:hypothetical protein
VPEKLVEPVAAKAFYPCSGRNLGCNNMVATPDGWCDTCKAEYEEDPDAFK